MLIQGIGMNRSKTSIIQGVLQCTQRGISLIRLYEKTVRIYSSDSIHKAVSSSKRLAF